MRQSAKLLIVILMFMLATAVCASAANEVKVVKVTGDVHYAGSDGAYKPLTKSVKLTVGQSVRTGADGEVVLTWFDGNAVKVSPLSVMRIEKLDRDGSTGLNLNHGRVFVKAKKLTNNSAFDVQTPVAVCGVRGTEFTVEHTAQGRSMFRVVDGTVMVKSQGVIKLVEQEFEMEVNDGNPPADAVRIPDDDITLLKAESDQLKIMIETEEKSDEQQGKNDSRKEKDDAAALLTDEFFRQSINDLILEHILTKAGDCCNY